jgi:beta-glucosidase
MGQEFHGKGANLALAPGLDVERIPVGGRNFEYLSGEDPYLGYILSQQAVKGIQDQKVMANAKHFVDNS